MIARGKPRIVPSVVVLMVVVYAFLAYSTISGFTRWPQLFQRTIVTRKDATPIGDDFKVVYLAIVNFAQRQPVYFTVPGKHPNYDHIPQSLLMMYPFTLFTLKNGYFTFIAFSCIALLLLYLYAVYRLFPQGLFFHLLFFPCIVLFSQAGLLLLNRGNMGALSSVFIFLGFCCLLHGKKTLLTVAVALATCIKPAYAPFALLILLDPKRVRLLTTFALVHGLILVAVVLIYGSTWILKAYFVELGSALEWMRHWHGDANIGLLSMISAFYPQHAPRLMTSTASLGVLAILVALLLGVMFRKRLRWSAMSLNDQLLLYGLLVYITVLWPPISFSYQALILLCIVPVIDRLYRETGSLVLKLLILAEAVALGLIFTPDGPDLPVIGFKAPYYVMGFVLLLGIWALTGKVRGSAEQ